ncbi:MAG TPA: hypothetical protein VIR57_22325 [Chloroflexota bacterium]
MTAADLPRGLPRRQACFLLHLANFPALDRRDYQALSGVSHTTAEHDLQALHAAGLIVRRGQGRATRYALKTPDEPADAPKLRS